MKNKKDQQKLLQRISGHESSSASSAQRGSVVLAKQKVKSSTQDTQFVGSVAKMNEKDKSFLASF
jgi:hypothetical protein